jgi:hypothetical protein
MAITRTTAQRLCSAPEFELVEASLPPSARQLTPGRLRQKVTRARRLRDKYRDLAKRQRLEARGKRAPQRARPAQGQENTERKAQLFQETLERFETQLSRTAADAAPDTAGAAKNATAKKATAKKATAKKATAKKTTAKKATAKKGAAKKGAAKKGAAKKATARPASPGKAGAAAMKGARSRPSVRGPQDAKQQARGATSRAHTRASNQRTQGRRDNRGN